MAVKNKVQLITYPDSLGGDLKSLNQVLETYFPNTFKGGIHILPPFPSSGDRGFAPLTYFEIEPKFGTWEDIRKIGEKHDVLLDLMVNHISRQSVFFKDFLKNACFFYFFVLNLILVSLFYIRRCNKKWLNVQYVKNQLITEINVA